MNIKNKKEDLTNQFNYMMKSSDKTYVNIDNLCDYVESFKSFQAGEGNIISSFTLPFDVDYVGNLL